MRVREWLELHERGRRRCVQVGTPETGAVVGLDLEGRVFACHQGELVHRVNPEAVLNQSHAGEYLNPGGDGFWPAPEGSTFGYEYSTGQWRVPPGLTGTRYRVLSREQGRVTIRAEVDLVNNRGRGLPVAFQREVAVHHEPGTLRLVMTDSLEYLGFGTLDAAAVRLAPWSLSQFDTSPGMEVVFPEAPSAAIRDFYEPSDDLRRLHKGLWHVRTEGGRRFQVGLGPEVEWIELRIPRRGLRVRRSARPISGRANCIDIADRPPDDPPSDFGVRYSVYNDAGGFMEIEAVGPGSDRLEPGTVLSHEIVDTFMFNDA